MEFRTLHQISSTTIHAAFIDAFSEYEVPMELPLDRLQTMMYMRSYAAELSLGCFVDDQLVGFVLVGARHDSNGLLRTYDVATGVVRAYQKQKIGSQLLTQLMPRLTQAGAASFQLEVLEHNVAAQKLYTTHGFTTTRRLQCYRTTHIEQVPPLAWGSWGSDAAALVNIDEALYSSFVPSWQQAMASYVRIADTCRVTTLHDANQLVAYGIIDATSTALMQIGVHPAYRTPDVLDALLDTLARSVNASTLRMVNVEANSWLDQQLHHRGWDNFINQFEMNIRLSD